MNQMQNVLCDQAHTRNKDKWQDEQVTQDIELVQLPGEQNEQDRDKRILLNNRKEKLRGRINNEWAKN